MGFYRGLNIVTDGLVFGYDADERSTRFYKGEPTTNEANTDIARTLVVLGGYDHVATFSDAPERGDGWKKVTVVTIGTNYRICQFPYIAQNSTTKTYSIEYDFNGNSGYYWGVDGSGGMVMDYSNGNKSVKTYTNSTTQYEAIFLNNDNINRTNVNEVIYYRYYQVEQKPHATQFTTGTRLSTQSLIDLKRTNTIDLSNVSFDWKGDPYFYKSGNNIISINTYPIVYTNFSVEAWIFLNGFDSNTNVGQVIAEQYSANSGWIFSLVGSSAYLELRNHNNGVGAYNLIYGTSLNIGKWYHVAASDDGTTVRLFIDGNVVASTNSATTTGAVSTPMRIGSFDTGYGVFSGKIKSLKLYNNALTPLEMLQNYNASKGRFEEENRLNEGLVLHFDANNKNSFVSGSTTWYDLAGANNGTLANGPTFNTVGDGSVVFDGIDDSMYIDLSTSMNDMYSKELTLTTVAMQTATNDVDGWLFDLDYVGYRLWGYANVAFRVRGPSAGWDDLYWTFNLNQWYHLTATFIDDGSTNNAKIYVNGQLYAQQTIPIKNIGPYSGVNYARMASHFGGGNSKPFKVGMFQKYKRALSTQEIATHYNKYKDRFGI